MGKIRNKKAVVFDVDNTLLDTHKIFIEANDNMRFILKEKFGDDLGDELMNGFMFDMYNEKGKYAGTVDNFLRSETFTKELVDKGLLNDSLDERYEIEKPFKDIYKEFPVFLPGAADLLKFLYTKGLIISFCTHSGEEWGKMKVDTIWKEMDFEGEPKYVSISLSDKKTSKDWAKVVDILGMEVSDIVVVGDNKEADILAAQEIGVDTCIWFKYLIKEKSTDFYTKGIDISNDHCIVYEVDGLEEIKELF